MREKNRYLLLEIICDDHLDWKRVRLDIREEDVTTAINQALQKVHGLIGAIQCQYKCRVKLLNKCTRIVYIRVCKNNQSLLVTALPFIKFLGNLSCSFRTLHMGGSVRSCHKVLQKYHREQLEILLSKCTTEEEKREIHSRIASSMAFVRGQKKFQKVDEMHMGIVNAEAELQSTSFQK